MREAGSHRRPRGVSRPGCGLLAALLLGFSLAGCAGPWAAYEGDRRAPGDVARIEVGINSGWTFYVLGIDGRTRPGGVNWKEVVEVLPGEHTVTVSASRSYWRFEGGGPVRIALEAGKTDQAWGVFLGSVPGDPPPREVHWLAKVVEKVAPDR